MKQKSKGEQPPHDAILKQAPNKEDEKAPAEALREKTKACVYFNFMDSESMVKSFQAVRDAKIEHFFILNAADKVHGKGALLKALVECGVDIIDDPYPIVRWTYLKSTKKDMNKAEERTGQRLEENKPKDSHSFTQAAEAAKRRVKAKVRYYEEEETEKIALIARKIGESRRLEEFERKGGKLSKKEELECRKILANFWASHCLSILDMLVSMKKATLPEVIMSNQAEFSETMHKAINSFAKSDEKLQENPEVSKAAKAMLGDIMRTMDKAGACIAGLRKNYSPSLVGDFYLRLGEMETSLYSLLNLKKEHVGLEKFEEELLKRFEKVIGEEKVLGKIGIEAQPYSLRLYTDFKSELKEKLGIDVSFDFPGDEIEKEPVLPLEFQLARHYGRWEENGDKEAELAARIALASKILWEEGKIYNYETEMAAVKLIGQLGAKECEAFYNAKLSKDQLWKAVGRYRAFKTALSIGDYIDTEEYMARACVDAKPGELAGAVKIYPGLLDSVAGDILERKGIKVLVDVPENRYPRRDLYLKKEDYDALVAHLKAEFKSSKGDAVPKALVIALKGEENAELVGRLRLVRELGMEFSESYLSMPKEEFEKMGLEEQRKRAELKADFINWFSKPKHRDDPALAYLRRFIFAEVPQADEKRETDKIAVRIMQSFEGSWEPKKPAGKFMEQLEAALAANPEKEKAVISAFLKAKLVIGIYHLEERIAKFTTEEWDSYGGGLEVERVAELAGKYGDVLLCATNPKGGVPFRAIADDVKGNLPNLGAMLGKMPFEWEATFLAEMEMADFNAARQEKILLLRESNVDVDADRKLIERVIEGKQVEAKPKVELVEVPAPAKEETVPAPTKEEKVELAVHTESAKLRMELNSRLAQCEAMKLFRQGEEAAFRAPSLKPLETFYKRRDIERLKKELRDPDAVRLRLLEMRQRGEE